MSTTRTEYEQIKTIGQVDVTRTSPRELKGMNLAVLLLMGPTGSGKSAFIETMSFDGALSISKDSLESVTQEVVSYQVVNVVPTYAESPTGGIILMDTPGFLDTKLSETRITNMILRELKALRASAVSVTIAILYFYPITDIRMAGSKRDAIMLLRAFAESFGAVDINLITTMWNVMFTPKQTIDAIRRLQALQADVFKKSENMGIIVHKFDCNRESSLVILGRSSGAWQYRSSGNLNPQFQSVALRTLIGRISSSEQRLQQLAEDRRLASVRGEREDHLLLEMVNQSEPAALLALDSFLDDLE